jgi:hypothetical protein
MKLLSEGKILSPAAKKGGLQTETISAISARSSAGLFFYLNF